MVFVSEYTNNKGNKQNTSIKTPIKMNKLQMNVVIRSCRNGKTLVYYFGNWDRPIDVLDNKMCTYAGFPLGYVRAPWLLLSNVSWTCEFYTIWNHSDESCMSKSPSQVRITNSITKISFSFLRSHKTLNFILNEYINLNKH